MKIRTTENSHAFQDILFKEIGIYSLQGLLMDENNNFTAAVEAVQFDEEENIVNPFSQFELYARYRLAEKLDIPFFVLLYHKDIFKIYKIYKSSDGDLKYLPKEELKSNKEFAEWWTIMKRREQSKPLANGAAPRANKTVFDQALSEYGLLWGGNVDGFYIQTQDNSIACIIDCISVSCNLDNDPYANPAYYFSSGNPKHGPRYEGWYSTVKLANELQIPHAVITLDKKNPNAKHVGLAFICELSREKLSFFESVSPNKNVIEGLEKIKTIFLSGASTYSYPIIK